MISGLQSCLRCITFLLVLWLSTASGAAFADHIIVEGDFNYPPYEYLDNGIPSGFNIDIIRAVAKVEGLHIRINMRKWSDVVNNLEVGVSDIATGMIYSPERAALYDFSIPHNIVSHSIFVRTGSNIASLNDLHGKEILVQRGDIMHEYALKHYPDAKIFPVTTQGDALRNLAAGKHDAALLGKLQNLFRADQEGLKNVVAVGPAFATGRYCFAVKKGREKLLGQLNEGLSLLKKTGQYDKIYEKWFGVHERDSLYAELLKWAAPVLGVLILFFCIFTLWVWLLRSRVRKKTEELTRELVEREKAEDELNNVKSYLTSVIDSMPSILIGVDKNCNVTQWNREAEKAIGVPLSEVLGLPLDLAAPHLACEMGLVREALKTGERQIDPKLRRYDDNRVRYEDVAVYPLVVKGVEGAVIRIDDITERINLEQMIMQSEKMMSIGGLAAGMAHEINNPLAVIVGQAQNIHRRTDPNLKKNRSVAEECETSIDLIHKYMDERGITRMLNSIIESGNRAAKIVVNMLSFSRKSDKVLDYYNIHDILDRTLELASSDYDLKKEYDFKQIEIVRDYVEDCPKICCEANEIQQVFLNIFKNGAEAMSDKVYMTGGPRFVLRVRPVGEYVKVEIEDNGPGLDVDTRKRIFEPFYTTKDVGQGTGLGLSVSYFIITDHHGGSLEVDSMLGHWTRFIIKFPIANKCEF